MDHTDPNTKQPHMMLILHVEVHLCVCVYSLHLYFGVFFKGNKLIVLANHAEKTQWNKLLKKEFLTLNILLIL